MQQNIVARGGLEHVVFDMMGGLLRVETIDGLVSIFGWTAMPYCQICPVYGNP